MLQVNLRERGRVVVEGTRTEVDLLPATLLSTVYGDPVDASKEFSTDGELGVRPQVDVEGQGICGHRVVVV